MDGLILHFMLQQPAGIKEYQYRHCPVSAPCCDDALHYEQLMTDISRQTVSYSPSVSLSPLSFLLGVTEENFPSKTNIVTFNIVTFNIEERWKLEKITKDNKKINKKLEIF